MSVAFVFKVEVNNVMVGIVPPKANERFGVCPTAGGNSGECPTMLLTQSRCRVCSSTSAESRVLALGQRHWAFQKFVLGALLSANRSLHDSTRVRVRVVTATLIIEIHIGIA